MLACFDYYIEEMKIFVTAVLLVICNIINAQALRNDIVMDEIMADPSPAALLINGLPEMEYIELKNVSQKIINLNGWKISDLTTTATINTSFILQPDSFVIICSTTSALKLSAFGRCLPVSNFPSLDNEGELLFLTSRDGRIIHAVEYSNKWYNNAVKSMGGWSLEMIDTKNACSGASNWKSSTNARGGTPGKRNAIDTSNPDQVAPVLLHTFANDSIHLTLIFDEPLDSLNAAITANYLVSDGIGSPVNAVVGSPLFNSVTLLLQQPLQHNKVYSVVSKNVNDCSGNKIGAINFAKAGLASAIENADVVINEILFNPKPDGCDFIELVNRTDKIVDLKDLYIANRPGGAVPGSLKQLSISSLFLFPNEYVTINENTQSTRQIYRPINPGAFIELSSLPSFPDDKGTVVLLNAMGQVIDEVAYTEKWHFKLIDNHEGISLEKIDINKPSQNPANWHSAATSAGYGTPGYRNSQFMSALSVDEAISISPKVFSPDNDGRDDMVTINYKFPEPGYVCNITIYSSNGLSVKRLTRNALCGLNGYFRWDGLNEQDSKLQVGVYVMITEVFTLQGQVKKFKNAFVLARQLK